MTFVPTWDIALLPPVGEMELDLAASAIEGGRALSGITGALDISGGGFLTLRVQFQLLRPDEHKYWNRMRARLNGGVRTVIMPLLTSWLGPYTINAAGDPIATVDGISHSDGTLFSDGTGYSEPAVTAEFTEDASLNAGTVSIVVNGATSELRGGEIFSVRHTVKNWRAYTIEEIVSGGGTPIYEVAIRPPLREAVVAGDLVEIVRPRCLMRLAAGGSMPWIVSGHWLGEPAPVTFVEAFIPTPQVATPGIWGIGSGNTWGVGGGNQWGLG